MKLLTTILLVLSSQFSEVFSQNIVTIPNVFTPNGDGHNDIFYIRGTNSFDELSCTIFNRYGEPIYRFYGLNGSWDGFSHAGVKVSAGVYFVLVEITNTDGETLTQQSSLQVNY